MYRVSLIMRFFITVIICLVFLSQFDLENTNSVEDSEIEIKTEDFSKLPKSQISESVSEGV